MMWTAADDGDTGSVEEKGSGVPSPGDQSIAELRTAVQLMPAEVSYRIGLGNGERARDRHDAAIAVFREATRDLPDAPEAHFALARAFMEAPPRFPGEDQAIPNEAVTELRTAVRLCPGDSAVSSVPW